MCARNQDATQPHRLGGIPVWFDGIRRVWEDQRAGSTLPDADELFLADLCEFMPNLILAYRDAIGGAFRIDFAGSVARTVLGGVVVGRHPEYAEPGTALAWIAAGYVAAGRGHIVGPVLVQARALVAAHLPYRDARGRVGLVLSAVARSTPCCRAAAGAEIIPFRRPQGG